MMDNAILAERIEMDLIGPNNQRRKQGHVIGSWRNTMHLVVCIKQVPGSARTRVHLVTKHGDAAADAADLHPFG